MKDFEITEGITFSHLFLQSKSMREIATLVKEVASTDIPVLITGESGTGKTLTAKAIHRLSNRASKPFVTVSCVNIPAELLESELFGYEKGAFTGAYQSKPGRIEFANKGTLFLDEIGDIPLSIQGKLLRVLQEGEFSRLGGFRDIKADVRVISATNRDLVSMIKEGRFREDLYFRINVISIKLPPLRERKEEIPFLVNYFQKKFCKEYNRKMRKISGECLNLLMKYHWPGNVRELENAIKRLVILGEESLIRELENYIQNSELEEPAEEVSPSELPVSEEVHVEYDLKKIAKMASMRAEKEVILEVLQKVKWNKKKAAQMLNISYKALLYKIKELNIV